MHEEEDHERRFGAGNSKRNHGIENPEVHEGNPPGSHSEGSQNGENQQIKFRSRVFVFSVLGHFVSSRMLWFCVYSIDQVKKREQVNPDDIDKVPVQPAQFDRRVIGWPKLTL